MHYTFKAWIRSVREYKHHSSFQICTYNPLCDRGSETEKTIHYLLHCPTCQHVRLTLLSKIK